MQDLHEEPEPGPDYPLQLLSLVRRHTVHSQLDTEELSEPLVLWVHPGAEGAESMESGREATAVSPLGRIRVELRFDSSLHPAVALCRRGGWLRGQAGVNRIIEPRVTDLGVGAAYYAQRIRIEGGGEPPA
jgi:anaerobic selenocysteine-containing dehydrogenase